jgi:mono/diheme cytochrome c family protein
MVTRIVGAIVLLCLAGCQQQMARQPSYRPLQASALFADGMSARPLVPGTIARDTPFASGLKAIDIKGWERAAGLVGKLAANPLQAAGTAADWSFYVDAFPMPITQELLERGRERFNIYCSVCHDRVGTGNGLIVQRGFTRPPNFHSDLSRGLKLRGIDVKLTEVPVGYFFTVISKGYGAMPDYAHQLPPEERWAVIAYIRALQLSQAATLADVRDPKEREQLLQTRGKQK